MTHVPETGASEMEPIYGADLAFCIRRNANGAMQIIHTLTLTLTLILTLNLTLISSYLTNKHQYTQPICPPICIAPFALRRIQNTDSPQICGACVMGISF